MKELNNIQVVDKNLHEIKNGMLRYCTSEFQIVGKLSNDDQNRKTHFRFIYITDYEVYVNAIDEGFDAEDANFIGYIYKINTSQFNGVNQSQYGKFLCLWSQYGKLCFQT